MPGNKKLLIDSLTMTIITVEDKYLTILPVYIMFRFVIYCIILLYEFFI